MYGVRFGNYHSWDDLRLILTNKEIGVPPAKTALIDIPGGDGVLDFTEFFGGVRYGNRKLSFEFATIVPQAEFMEQFAAVQNALHGQKVRISLDVDPEWYYIGRISVDTWKTDKRVGKITVECDCEPYKYRLTAQTVNLSGVNMINLDSGIPTVDGAWAKTDTGYSFTRGDAGGGSFCWFPVPVQKGREYVFSADYSLSSRLLYVYRDKLYGDLVAKSDSGKPCVFTAASTGVYVFGLYCSSNVADGVFDNVMLRESGASGEFALYDATEKTVEATFRNTRQRATPTIYVSGAMSVETPANYAALSPGANVYTEFSFGQGNNALTFKGHGTAVVEWKEGGL